MKRLTILLLLLCLLGGTFAAAEADRSFTDSTGRTFALPEQIGRVAVSGTMAQTVVFPLASDLLCGIADKWSDSARGILSDEALALPVLGQIYGGKGNLNPETLLAAAPDLLIDVGEHRDGIAEDMDALEAQIGVPCVHIDIDLGGIPEAFRMLGALLNRPTEAETLASYAETILTRTRAIADHAEKVRLMYVIGSDGLNVIARDSYHSEVLDLLGDNVAVVETPSAKGTGNEVDMEQILVWDPDFIIFAPDSIFDSVAELENWQTVSAIRNGRYVEVPDAPCNWMGFPPSVQRLMGMSWLAKLLYPQATDYDLFEETKTFFSLFYHCDLTEEMFDTLMKNALIREREPQ